MSSRAATACPSPPDWRRSRHCSRRCRSARRSSFRVTATTARAVCWNAWKRKADSARGPSTWSIPKRSSTRWTAPTCCGSSPRPIRCSASPTCRRSLRAARDIGLFAVVDNTFATPMLQQPLALGRERRRALGHEVHRRTLRPLDGRGHRRRRAPARRTRGVAHDPGRDPRRHGGLPRAARTAHVARSIRPSAAHARPNSPNVSTTIVTSHRVRYPGLISDPGFERRQHADGGIRRDAVLRGQPTRRARTGSSSRCNSIVGGTSLGGVESTIDRRARWTGEEILPGGLLRLSVGFEHPVDLWADLDEALNAVFT